LSFTAFAMIGFIARLFGYRRVVFIKYVKYPRGSSTPPVSTASHNDNGFDTARRCVLKGDVRPAATEMTAKENIAFG
jgi:hypothetical protein